MDTRPPTAQHPRPIVAAGFGGVSLVALALGLAATRITASDSAFIVAIVVTATTGLIGGFFATPSLRRLAWREPNGHGDGSRRRP